MNEDLISSSLGGKPFDRSCPKTGIPYVLLFAHLMHCQKQPYCTDHHWDPMFLVTNFATTFQL